MKNNNGKFTDYGDFLVYPLVKKEGKIKKWWRGMMIEREKKRKLGRLYLLTLITGRQLRIHCRNWKECQMIFQTVYGELKMIEKVSFEGYKILVLDKYLKKYKM